MNPALLIKNLVQKAKNALAQKMRVGVYSYDVHGNVQTLIQDDSVYSVGTGQRYKRLDYQYDLVGNNVNEVDYQNDSLDQYHTKYTWDADNRPVQIQTSKDSVNWDNDASYFYYAHGPLARIELGDQQVQGMDYAYTLQGWPKAVNSDKLTANNDMGHDAQQNSSNLNRYFARDAMGYTLKYFDHSKNPTGGEYPGDYDAIDTSTWNHITKRFEAYTYGSDLTNNRRDLFSGNITVLATNIQQPQVYSENTPTQTAILLPQGTAYGYDQLKRMVEMKAFQNLDTTTNVWGTTGTYNGLYHNWLSYDANGNILTQKRADSLGEVFDSLTYHYNVSGGNTIQNRLYHVNDVANVSTIHDDIKDEGTFTSSSTTINEKNNYRYNAMGQLAKDTSAGLDTIIWTNYGKVWKIKKYSGDSIVFAYNGNQDKILKEYKPASGNPISTYYVRDAKGNVASIYKKQSVGMSMTYALIERDIFGIKRLGAEKTPVQLIGTLGQALKVDTFKRYLGNKEYELDNHLGNVLAIISDRKIPRPNSAHDSINHYEADLVSSQDMFAFGQLFPGRSFSSASYRYGFNGKEKVDEITGFTGTDYDYGKRMYDARLSRFMSVDPLAMQYPWLTPYQFAGNNPVQFIDIDGLEQISPGNALDYIANAFSEVEQGFASMFSFSTHLDNTKEVSVATNKAAVTVTNTTAASTTGRITFDPGNLFTQPADGSNNVSFSSAITKTTETKVENSVQVQINGVVGNVPVGGDVTQTSDNKGNSSTTAKVGVTKGSVNATSSLKIEQKSDGTTSATAENKVKVSTPGSASANASGSYQLGVSKGPNGGQITAGVDLSVGVSNTQTTIVNSNITVNTKTSSSAGVSGKITIKTP